MIVGERLRPVLPRELGVLGPLDLRPLPDDRDHRRPRRRRPRRVEADRGHGGGRARARSGSVSLLSYSQSSFAGLIVAVVLLMAIVWRRAAVLAAAVRRGRPALDRDREPEHPERLRSSAPGAALNRATSDRAGLIYNGIRIAIDHPLIGVGVGGFRHHYAELTHLKGKEPKKAASHDSPVTVAAEGGVVGPRALRLDPRRRLPDARADEGRAFTNRVDARPCRSASPRSASTRSSTTTSSRTRPPGALRTRRARRRAAANQVSGGSGPGSEASLSEDLLTQAAAVPRTRSDHAASGLGRLGAR